MPYKRIEFGDEIYQGLGGERYSKLAAVASFYNDALDDNTKASYLRELRGHAERLADTQTIEFRYSNLTTDQLVDAVGTIRGTAMRVIALCDGARS